MVLYLDVAGAHFELGFGFLGSPIRIGLVNSE
jgi:hypothetical protein